MFYVVDSQQKSSLLAFSKNELQAQLIADQLNFYVEKCFISGPAVVILSDEMRTIVSNDPECESSVKTFETIENGAIDLNWTLARFSYEQSILDINEQRELDEIDEMISLFEGECTSIHNPYLSECGRFSTTPILTYGLYYINAFNLYPDDPNALALEQKISIAHVLTQLSIKSGALKPLSSGAPDHEDETFYTISSQFSTGSQQDQIVKILSERFPDFS